MSNHHWEPSPTAVRSKVAQWAVPATIVFALVVLLLNFVPRPQPHADWKTSSAHVLGTRITTRGYRDASQARPAEIYYRGEANVTYEANGKQYTQWIPVTSNSTDRDWLAFRLSERKGDNAEVKWNPSDPSQAVATLHLR